MSHYNLLVVDTKNQGLEKLMEPFDNLQWDWYVVGGRWNYSLPLHKGPHANITTLDNLNYRYFDENLYEKKKRYWEVIVDGDELKESENKEDFFNIYKKEYYERRYIDKENFAKEMAKFSTYALLIDGEWIEPGNMGWFGASSETAESQKEYLETFVKRLNELSKTNPKAVVYLVDCHI